MDEDNSDDEKDDPMDEARKNFEESINRRNARKWRVNTQNSSKEYEDEFAGILMDQIEAADETSHLRGYERLQAYADRMMEKQGGDSDDDS